MPQSLFKEAPTVTVQDGRPTINNEQQGLASGSFSAVSPTGAPVVPPAAVPYLLAGVVGMDVLAEEFSDPSPWTAARTLRLVSRLVVYAVLGASPGLRRK